MKRIMKRTMTLQELSTELLGKGFRDLFDFQVDGDILNTTEMVGSVADIAGDNIIEFSIIKLSPETGHLETIIETIIEI